MALRVLTPEQWAQLGIDLGKRLAADRAAEAKRQVLLHGAVQVLLAELR